MVSFQASKDLPDAPASDSDAEDAKEEETLKQKLKKQRKLEAQNVHKVKLQFEIMEKAAKLGRKLSEDRLQEIEDEKDENQAGDIFFKKSLGIL